MLILQRIANLLGGISRRHPWERLASQAEAQENALASVDRGLMKRPPFEFVKKLAELTGWNDPLIHPVFRDDSIRYFVVIANSGIKVIDADTGVESTVTNLSSGYLSSVGSDFRAVTVGDTTFIANTGITPAMLTTRTAVQEQEALIFVRQADFATTYTVTIFGTPFSYTTPVGLDASARQSIDTTDIALALYQKIVANIVIGFLFTPQVIGSSIYLHSRFGLAFSLESEDGLADQGMKVIKGKVESFADLPRRAKPGMIVEVTGDVSTGFDNFWVVYEESNDDSTAGVWRETIAPNIRTSLNPATMPHRLVRGGSLIPQQYAHTPPAAPVIGDSTTGFTAIALFETIANVAITDDDYVLTEHSTGLKVAPAGSTGALERFIFGIDVDTSGLQPGTSVLVTVEKNSALDGGFTVQQTYGFGAGAYVANIPLDLSFTLNSGAEVAIRLKYSTGATPVVEAYRAALTVHRSTHTLPGLRKFTGVYSTTALFDPSITYPLGASLSLVLDEEDAVVTVVDTFTGADGTQLIGNGWSGSSSFVTYLGNRAKQVWAGSGTVSNIYRQVTQQLGNFSIYADITTAAANNTGHKIGFIARRPNVASTPNAGIYCYVQPETGGATVKIVLARTNAGGGIIDTAEATGVVWGAATTKRLKLRVIGSTATLSVEPAGGGAEIDSCSVTLTDTLSSQDGFGLYYTTAGTSDFYWDNVTVSDDGTTRTFTRTLSVDESGLVSATGLQSTIDADANFACSISGSTLTITRQTGTGAITARAAVTLPPLMFYNDGLTLVADAQIGRTLANIDDGSSGTVNDNGVLWLTVTSLTGGVANVFATGNRIDLTTGGGVAFVFEPVPWNARVVGDDETNKEPSFIGRPIQTLFFHQNRLGFTAGEHIIMSASGNLFNFWRDTVTTLEDGAPIDVQSAHAEVSVFYAAPKWNGQQLLFAETGQFLLAGDPVMTPRTVRLDLVAAHPSDGRVQPVVFGNRIIFAHDLQGSARVMEWLPHGENQEPQEPADLTRDVAGYLTGRVKWMGGDSNLGLLYVLTTGDTTKLHVYSADFVGNKKIVEGWGHWTSTTVRGGAFLGGYFLGVVARPDGIFLERGDLDVLEPAADEASKYLDRQIIETECVSVVYSNPTTTWTLPYSVATNGSEGTLVVVNRTTGARITTTRPTATTVAATGNYSATQVHIGILYTFRYRLSSLYVRDQSGSPETGGRTQVRWMDVAYQHTNDLTVSVTPAGRTARTKVLATVTSATGKLHVPVMTRAETAIIEISSGSSGGCRLSSLEWEAFLSRRNRRF